MAFCSNFGNATLQCNFDHQKNAGMPVKSEAALAEFNTMVELLNSEWGQRLSRCSWDYRASSHRISLSLTAVSGNANFLRSNLITCSATWGL